MFFSYFPFERNLWDLCFLTFPVRPGISLGLFNIDTICHNSVNENDLN